MKKLFILGCLSLFILGAQAQMIVGNSDQKAKREVSGTKFDRFGKSNTKEDGVLPLPYRTSFEGASALADLVGDYWYFNNWFYCWGDVWNITDPYGEDGPDCDYGNCMWSLYNMQGAAISAFHGQNAIGLVKKEAATTGDYLVSPYFQADQTGVYAISFKSNVFSLKDSMWFECYKSSSVNGLDDKVYNEQPDPFYWKRIMNNNIKTWESKMLQVSLTAGEYFCFSLWANANHLETAIFVDSVSVSYAGTTMTYPLTISVNPVGCGTVTVNGAPATSTIWLAKGEALTMVATPNGNAEFTGWTGQLTAPNATINTAMIDGDVYLTANFTNCGSTPPNSVQESELSNINIYPNPITDMLTIKTDRSYDITVSDVAGRVVLQQKLNNENSTVDFSSYQSGVYFIQFRNAEETKTVKVFKAQ